jgi:CheY-like chemotaxis protein
MTAPCPRCSARITATPDERGMLSCAQCGARLRPVAASAASARPTPTDSRHPDPIGVALESLRSEVAVLRRGQEQLLQGLQDVLAALSPRPVEKALSPASDSAPDPPIATSEPIPRSVETNGRARTRQKTVLVVDDDENSCREVLAALESAQVSARSVSDGNAALAAIATYKPDVLVVELALSGATVGRDVINMVKATMEWVNICVVLYTRIRIEDDADVRTIHGADEFVAKAPGSAEVLAARVSQILQRS